MQITSITNAEQIIHVIHQAYKRYETDPMPSSALVETSETIKQNLHEGNTILGAINNHKLIGVVKVTPIENKLYFSRLAVLPTYQRKGVASALIQELEKYAQEQKLDGVFCKVRKSETVNIQLYKKLGYTIVKEELTTSPTGYTMETVTMEKKIAL